MSIFMKFMAITGLMVFMTGCSSSNSVKDTGGPKDTAQDIAVDADSSDNLVGYDTYEDVHSRGDTCLSCDVRMDFWIDEDTNEVKDILPGDADQGINEDVYYPGDPCLPYDIRMDFWIDEDTNEVRDILPGDTDATTGTRPGECSTIGDCNGHQCKTLDGIGFNVCLQDIPPELTQCTDPKNPAFDECCSSSECTDPGAGCYYTHHIQYYGGAMPLDYKFCISDECNIDSDCETTNNNNKIPGLCLPAGVNGWPKTRCITDYCARFGGCDAGSYCRPMANPCNSGVYIGGFCASEDTCETDSDCKNGQQCVGDVKTGKTKCQTVYCPA